MVYVFLAEGFEELEALTPVDLIRRAGIEVRTVAVGGDNKVKGAHGVEVIADLRESELCDRRPNVVLLPGGMPGTRNLELSEVVAISIENALSIGSLVCAICAAPSVLGKRGYLEGKKATCFPGFEQYLEGAIVNPDARVVRDGNIITAKGAGCATEFALAIIEALTDRETAHRVARESFSERIIYRSFKLGDRVRIIDSGKTGEICDVSAPDCEVRYIVDCSGETESDELPDCIITVDETEIEII